MFLLSDDHIDFPSPELANIYGVLAIGGDLSPERLLMAYRKGIFPWYNPGDPITWWSPDPRFVLFPDELKVSKSMRPYFNQRKFEVSWDRSFREVITACRTAPRRGQPGTWITEDMLEAYVHLHELGYAHSVEVWDGEELVGGLYGVSLGKIFFGESMFSLVSNASKFGFITKVRRLREAGFRLIDCQVPTQHLGRLGARPISRKAFLECLSENEGEPTMVGNWEELLGKKE